jgi:serine/threonine-protein kinase
MVSKPGGNLPRVLGGYELLERVGAGGMGVVYKATDRRSGTTVAVKIIHEHLQSDVAFVARFRDEAHLASLLSSPYIVRVIEFGSDQGEYFLATEFVEGSRLSDLIAASPDGLGVEESLAIAVQVAMALQAAGAHSVVHRDVKPDNIVITPDKSVKLMDFGVARLSYVETRQLFLGTVAYAAPEQFRGQTTARSDIYSLGVVLFQMLTGELPFKGETLSALMRMHDETPPPLEKLDGMPAAVREVVAKCLEKDPANRYQNPAELISALRQVRQSLSKPAEPSWISDAMTRIADTIIPSAATAGTVRASTSAAELRQPVLQDVSTPAAPTAPASVAAEPPAPPRRPVVTPRARPDPNRLPWFAAGGAVALALIAGAVFALGGDGDTETPAEPTAVAVIAPEPTQPPSPTPVPPTPVPEPVAPAQPPPAAPAAPAPVVVAPAAPPASVPAAPPPVVVPPTNTPVPPPPPAASGTFNLVGFADQTGPDNFAPSNAVRSGGTFRSCNPQFLYAFVNFSNVQPPKQFVAIWTINGSQLAPDTFQQTERQGQLFWRTPPGTLLNPGSYRFQLRVDNAVATDGSFTVVC